jgi:DNA-binding protein HU-beta
MLSVPGVSSRAQTFPYTESQKALFSVIKSAVGARNALRHRANLISLTLSWAHGALEGAEVMAAAAAKPKASKPVTTKHLAYTLADQHQMTKKQGTEMLEDLVTLITKHLKKGERVKIAGLGILQVRKRAARMGRNPATGEAIKIKASKKVAFRATKELKEAI